MPSLRLAVQADQALLLPPLLVVAYLQHVKSVGSLSVELEDVAAINDNGIAIAFDTGKGRVVHDGHVLPCLMEAYGPAEWRDAGAVSREYLSKAV